MSQPTPFERIEVEGRPVLSNGQVNVMIMAEEGQGRLFKRRAQRGLSPKPPGETVLPLLNSLAGELVSKLDMSPLELQTKLQFILSQASPRTPENVEWAVAELDGVRAYVDGSNVILSKMDLMP